MADESTSEDRSLEPSERKLQKAREQGRFAQSRDLSFLALMLLATAFVLLVGKAAWRACERMVRDALDLSRHADPLQHLTAWAGDALWDFALWLAVFLAAGLIAGLLAPLALTQLRPVFAPRFDLSRLDPVAGLKRLFTAHQLFALAKGVLVTLALLGVAAAWFAAQADALALPPTAALDAAMARLASLLGRGWQWLLLVVAVVAAVDAGFQWRQFRREMRMTVQELKEEHKESEGSPEVRARIRQLQREASRRRMMAAVEKADVLVVNPTHFAVALRYDARRMSAPVVVAKGEDEVALRMREVARRHEVPVAESPALARWLSARVEVGQPLPAPVYAIAARLLAWAYDARDGAPGLPPPAGLDDEVAAL